MTPYQTAKANGERFYVSSPCRHGHPTGRRYTSTKHCVECELIKSAKRQRENPKYFADAQSVWRKKHPEQVAEIWRECREKYKEKRNAYGREYKRKNRAAMSALEMKRHCAMMQRIPPWADLEKIKDVYIRAAMMRQETGINYEVDHAIPLQGKLVSGLHVHNNLQILTAIENVRKHNNFSV